MKSNHTVEFPDTQIKKAAEWWAQYLPGIKYISFDEINQNAKLEGRTKVLSEAHHNVSSLHQKQITDEQYENFVKILSDKIRTTLKPRQAYTGLNYLQMGFASSYHPPKIIEEALDEAHIKVSSYGLFPYKTEMRIYNNGQITIGKKVIITNPSYEHFNPMQLDLISKAPFFKIDGQKFRLVEVDLEKVKSSHLIEGEIARKTKFDIDCVKLGVEDPKDVIEKIYTKIDLNTFKGEESDFLKMSNQQLVELLQNHKKFKEVFTENWVFYDTSKEASLKPTSYSSVGRVTAESLGEDFYQYTTGPVQVIMAPQDGTIGSYILQPVKKGDFLLYRKDQTTFGYMSPAFEARLCDEQGHILSEKIYKAGDVLPQPARPAVMIGKVIGEELAIATISQIFKTMPNRMAHLVPLENWNLFQKIILFGANQLIDNYAIQMIKGGIPVPEGIAACSIIAIGETITLKDTNRKDSTSNLAKVFKLPSVEDIKSVSKIATQSILTQIFKEKTSKMGATIFQKSGTLATSGVTTTGFITHMLSPLAVALVSSGVQQLRLPGVQQASEDEETVAQQIGHITVCAGITASVAMLPVSVPVAAAGCFIGVIANTIFGKKRESMQVLSQNTNVDAELRLKRK